MAPKLDSNVEIQPKSPDANSVISNEINLACLSFLGRPTSHV